MFLKKTWSSPLFMVLAPITSCFALPSLKILRSLISLNFGLELSLLMPNDLVLLLPLQLLLSSIIVKPPLPVAITAFFTLVVVPTMAASDVVVTPNNKPLHSHRLRLIFQCNSNMCLHLGRLLHLLGLVPPPNGLLGSAPQWYPNCHSSQHGLSQCPHRFSSPNTAALFAGVHYVADPN